jgi:hypothetical protein
MFVMKGIATKRRKLNRCKHCGLIWRSTSRKKEKVCPRCLGFGWTPKKTT